MRLAVSPGPHRPTAGFGQLGAAVVREQPPSRNPLTAKPGHIPDQEPNCVGLFLIGQHLAISQGGGIDDAQMVFLGASTTRAVKAPITSDPVLVVIELGQLIDVNVDHVARPRSLVMPHRHRPLQMLQVSQTDGFEATAVGGERAGQQVGNA
jgi:hypothetical protein